MTLLNKFRRLLSLTGILALGTGLVYTFILSLPKAEAASGDIYIAGNPGQFLPQKSIVPDKIRDLQFSGFDTISVRSGGGLGIKTNGDVYGWGYAFMADGSSNRAYLADITKKPVAITSLTDASKVYYLTDGVQMMIKNDGTLWSWGSDSNFCGLLGRPTIDDNEDYTPGQVTGLSNVVDVAFANNGVFALQSDGNVYSWGCNSDGYLGHGDYTDRTSPTQITGLSNISKISAYKEGVSPILALNSSGNVYSWGPNTFGELGLGDTSARQSPQLISGISNVAEIAAGMRFSLFVDTSGNLYGNGYNFDGVLGSTTTGLTTPTQVSGVSGVAKVVAGNYFSYILKTNGTLQSSGRNGEGQLGRGNISYSQTSFGNVIGFTAPKSMQVAGNGMVFVEDTSSTYTSVNLSTVEGQIFYTYNGIHIPIDGTSNFIKGDSADGQYVALKDDGTVWTFSNFNPSLSQVPNLTDVTFVAIGEQDSFSYEPYYFAIKSDGTLWTWGGTGYYGRMGIGASNAGSGNEFNVITEPVQVPGLSNVIYVDAGQDHSAAITSDNTLYTWGMDTYRDPLGYDTDSRPLYCVDDFHDYCHTPSSVPGVSALKVQVGDDSNTDSDNASTLVLKTDGTLQYWGTGTSYWDALSSFSGITDIAIDNTYGSVVGLIKNDNTVWTFGNNSFGQLGRDTGYVSDGVPGQVLGINNAYKIGTSFDHMSVILTDGTIWSWGAGNTGNGRTVDSWIPKQIPGILWGKELSRNPDLIISGTQNESQPPSSCDINSLGNGAGSGAGNVNTNVLLCVGAGVLTIYAGDSSDNNDICTPTNITNADTVSVEASNQAATNVTCSTAENSLALSGMFVSSTRQSATAIMDDVVFEDLRGLETADYTITATISNFTDGAKSITLGDNPDSATSDTDADAPVGGDNGKLFATLNCSGGTVSPLRNAQTVSEGIANYQKGSSTTVIDNTSTITMLSTTAAVKPGRIDLDGCNVKLRVPAFVQAGNYSGTIVQTII